jgi:hypothetical protein
MPKISPNFNEATKRSEPGTYLCRILSSEIRTAKSSGNLYVAWKLQTQPDGRWVFYNTPIEGKGAGMFKHFIHSAGDESYQGGDYDTDTVLGKTVMMNLDVEPGTGYFKVIAVSKPTADQPMFEDDLPF